MELAQVKNLVSQGENERLEFKSSIAELDKLGKALCGQMNAEGGYGFVGVNDSGKIIGAEVSDSTNKKLTAFKNYFDPWPEISIDYIPLPDSPKKVISFYCPPRNSKGPFTFRGRAYLKTPSGIKPMPSEKYKHKLMENAGASKAWELLPVVSHSIEDLDHAEIIKTFKIGLREGRIPDDEYTENVHEILTHFDLVDGDDLTNAAIALFAKKMPATFSQCFLRMGHFVDDTMDEVIDSQQLRGNAFQLIQAATDFVKRNLALSSHYQRDKFERVDHVTLPLLAIREAIVNAICHRDYFNPSGDVSIYIFNDSLEIHNIGHLFGGLTVEQLIVRHPSRRRNERIAQVFHTRKLIDRFGGGTRRMIRLCSEQGVPLPIFSEESDGFLVRFPFRKRLEVNTPDVPIVLSQRQADILQHLKEKGALSTAELRANLDNPPSERWLRGELNALLNEGIIGVEGATNKRKWFFINK